MSGPDDDPRPVESGDADQAFIRGLLGEVGRAPEPLPEDVAARLDDVLAGLVAERAAGDAEAEPPAAIPLERARRRRRRATQALTAAAAVVVVGYAGGQLLVQGGTGDDAMSSSDAGGAAAPEAADASGGGSSTSEDAFPLTSEGLRSDARRLVASDTRIYLSELGSQAAPDVTADRDDVQGAPGPPAGADERGKTSAPAQQRAGGSRRDGTCVDPLVAARLTRLSVTYDGAAATAVLRPVTGADRVRVEVWDCATPRRVASVVVRR